MLLKENIICIANTSWFGNYAKSTVQLLERLAADNRVLFVEYPFTIKDVFATLRGKQNAPVKRMLRWHKPLQKIQTNAGTEVHSLVVPPVIPVFFLKNERVFNLLFRLNVSIYKKAVKRAIKQSGFTNPIVITAYNPIYGNAMIGTMGEKAHIYYCYDGVEAGFFGKRIFKIEEDFARKADGVITTSEYLNAAKSPLNPHCDVVKNGVDFPVFVQYAKSQPHQHQRKKVGFIGSLDARFDIDTVECAVKALPGYDFEFTGDLKNQTMMMRLQKYDNVKFCQPVAPNDVPQLLATCDAGIIPYLVNEVNRNIYPLKINEYLAVGVPVVMNAFAVLPEFEGLVSVSVDPADFVRKIVEEVENDSIGKIAARIEFASHNSWEARTRQFGEAVAKIVNEKVQI